MAGHALVVPGTDQPPHRERGLAQRRQPGPARPGEVLRRPGVVRRGRAAGRRDPGLHHLDRVGEVEVRPGQAGHRLVHQPLQPVPDRVDALDHLAVGVEVVHRFRRRRARQDLLRLARACRRGSAGTAPSPTRRPRRGRAWRRSSAGRPRGNAPPQRRPACPRRQAGNPRAASRAAPATAASAAALAVSRSARSAAELSAGRRRGEVGEPAGPVPGREPRIELARHGLHLARCRIQPARRALGQRLAIPGQRGRHAADRRAMVAQSSAVAVGISRNTPRTCCGGPKMFDIARRFSPVAAIASSVSSRSRSSRAHRRSSPSANPPRPAACSMSASLPERGALQLVLRFLPGRRQVRQLVLADWQPEIGRDDRIELGHAAARTRPRRRGPAGRRVGRFSGSGGGGLLSCGTFCPLPASARRRPGR